MTGSTRTSDLWAVSPGKLDTLNLGHAYPSTSPYGIPTLAPTDTVPTELAAWHVARQRQHAAEHRGAIHFFLDDYRFESVWTSPARSLARVSAVGTVLTPDYSLWPDMPLAVQMWQSYRRAWMGAFWQAHGIDVIPTACWSTPASFAFCFDGLPLGGTVAVSTVGVRSRDADAYRVGLEQLLYKVQPCHLLIYGRNIHSDGLTMPPVTTYPTFWDRRRKGERWAAEAQADTVTVAAGP